MFILQIHGLPLKLLYKKNAMMIRSKIGLVQEDTISRRSVVNQQYLCFSVDIPIISVLPAGFMQTMDNGDKYWVQFKDEWLVDFCYKCVLW